MKELFPESSSSKQGTSSRRGFLKGIAVAGVAAASPALLPATADAAPKPKTETVFRFKVRKTLRCNACSEHHKFKVFLTRADADNGRAHPGCNCPIVPQKVSKKEFQRLFGGSATTGTALSGSVDLRRLGRV